MITLAASATDTVEHDERDGATSAAVIRLTASERHDRMAASAAVTITGNSNTISGGTGCDDDVWGDRTDTVEQRRADDQPGQRGHADGVERHDVVPAGRR